uniref:Uncharacterized protein n=1 Tax=Hyaloperonospora arabidopsidis (strain Emoy2) TaxID=559515 RepID=M4BIT0_HYAAE
MMSFRTAALFAGLALTSSAAQEQQPVHDLGLNAYDQARDVTLNEVAFLTTTACHPSLYNADVTSRVCFTEFTTVTTQTSGGGTYYKFQVKGCPVDTEKQLGYCREGACSTTSLYEVAIYSQPRTSAVFLTSIKEVV